MEQRETRYQMIYAAISEAMADVGAVSKDKKNQQQGWNFRGIDDIYNALHPVLAKHGLFMVPEVLENNRTEFQTAKGGKLNSVVMKIKYTLYATDGSSVSATVIGEGMDSGDKASNKAMSIAMKYAMFQIFCIPTEETIDPDATRPELEEPDQAEEPEHLICEECGQPVCGLKDKDGNVKKTLQQVAEFTKQASGKLICWNCYKKDPNKWKLPQE